MNGLDLFRSPKTAADEIADIVSAQCPPVVPENCDAFSCRECWLAWLTTGEPPKEKGPSDKQTAPGRDSAPYYPPTEAIRKAAERLKDGNMEYTAKGRLQTSPKRAEKVHPGGRQVRPFSGEEQRRPMA